jgi:hypothetical protein
MNTKITIMNADNPVFKKEIIEFAKKKDYPVRVVFNHATDFQEIFDNVSWINSYKTGVTKIIKC